jgi:3-hydroxybutyryl-CoA dehydrogenase
MDAQGVKQILVIGAGTMGEGIAQIFAQAGLDVLQVDIDPKALERSQGQVLSNLQMMGEFNLLSEAPETILSRIRQQRIDSMAGAAGVCVGMDFVVEAIPENLDLKRELFHALDDCPAEMILSTNTSSLTISEITEGLKTPQRVVGLHFFFPAHIVPLVEIHGCAKTSTDVIAVTRDLMKRVGKQPIVVRKELPGFIVNRIQAACNREVTYLLDQGVATAEELDLAAKAGFGFRLACLGPLEIHDLNGLDIVMRAGGKTRQSICNDREHSRSLVQKVENGQLGVKTGKGWHDYTGRSREEVLDASNKKLLRQLALFQIQEKLSKES